MLTRRIIVCLDVLGGEVVKGIRFESIVSMGDPATLASRYEADGADEIVLLNIAAARDDVRVLLSTVRRTADRLTIPLTIGGGIGSIEQIEAMLVAGADKVSINSAAVSNPSLLTDAASRFGSQCVVASIDARKEKFGWRVYTHGGRMLTGLEAGGWAEECAARGAGEILLTSIDRDGTREGYDVDLTASVADAVDVPVIASGGAGGTSHIIEIFESSAAQAALVAGIVHDGSCSVREIKEVMRRQSIPVRMIA
jgi:cyclase